MTFTMNITKQRKLWFTISAALVLASFALMGTLGLNLGLDFTGGARWDIQFKDQTLVSNQQLASFFKDQPSLTQGTQIQSSDDGTFLITIQDLDDDQIQA
ncbi:MAG TPA: hypothetical protein VIT68_02505, partial [Candidatus Gracilibacteria bacterium]